MADEKDYEQEVRSIHPRATCIEWRGPHGLDIKHYFIYPDGKIFRAISRGWSEEKSAWKDAYSQLGGAPLPSLEGEPKWTSGAWYAMDTRPIGLGMNVASIRPSGSIDEICDVGGPEAEANAALLAAAHDLYNALKALLPEGWGDGSMDHMPGVKQARIALAKALPSEVR